MKKLLLLLSALLALTLCGCGAAEALEEAPPERCAFEIFYDGELGNACCDQPDGYYDAGTAMTAMATGKPGWDFLCWTTGGYFSDGGTDVSHEVNYSFALSRDTALYANFKSSELAMVCYHYNDGTDGVLWDDFSLAYYRYPSALGAQAPFTRDGYVLIAYNTQPDGSGEAVNLGGKALLETDRAIDLYCVWAQITPETVFTYAYNETLGGWFITGYSGNYETVCLPVFHDGGAVIGVAAGALSGASMQTLVIPVGIQTVADTCCENCPNLRSLYVFDTLDYISDLSFNGCEALHSVYFNAAEAPRFTLWFNYHCKKIENLVWSCRHAAGPRLLLLGGSSTNYGVDAELLQTLLDEDYTVINMGTNGANLFSLTSEWILPYLNAGDILMQIPEYNSWQLGGVVMRWEVFRSFEGIYDIFRWVDYQYYGNMLGAFCDFLKNRADMPDRDYEAYVCDNAPLGYYTDQGTLTVRCHGQTADFWSGRVWWLYDSVIPAERVEVLNRQYAKLAAAGVTLWMGFPASNKNAFSTDQTEAQLTGYMNQLDRDLTPITRICDIHDYIFDATLFFDDDYHVGYDGQQIYTRQLAEDLNAALASLPH